MAAIGISLWKEGKPYEEISIPVCIALTEKECNFADAPSLTFANSTIFKRRLGSDRANVTPSASIHILQLSDGLWGVLSTSDVPSTPLQNKYTTWKISHSYSQFEAKLVDAQQSFGQATDDPFSLGAAFTTLLFPNTDDGNAARKRFHSFVDSNKQKALFSSFMQTIHVRTILRDAPQPFLYPIGLLYLDENEDPSSFVGYHFFIETPLPEEFQGPEQQACIKTWVPVIPPIGTTTPVLVDAYERIKTKLAKQPDDGPTSYKLSNGNSFEAFTDMKEFNKTWIRDKSHKERPPAVIAVLSHHDISKIYFTKESYVLASNVDASVPFAQPAAAIFAGCTTGAAGASYFLESFNKKHVDAVIATNTGISGFLAGDFMNCISQVLEKAKAEGLQSISIGELYRRTEECLYKLTDDEGKESRHGPRVLSFTFAGNPQLRLCTGGS
jgi:hypothetical protein